MVKESFDAVKALHKPDAKEALKNTLIVMAVSAVSGSIIALIGACVQGVLRLFM